MKMTERQELQAEIVMLESRYNDLMECYIKLLDLGVKPHELPHPWADNGETALVEVIDYLQEGRKNRVPRMESADNLRAMLKSGARSSFDDEAKPTMSVVEALRKKTGGNKKS